MQIGGGLAQELAPVRVNTLPPGTIDTPILGKAMGDDRDAFDDFALQPLRLGERHMTKP